MFPCADVITPDGKAMERLEMNGPLRLKEPTSQLFYRAFSFPEAEHGCGASAPLLLTVPEGEPPRLHVVVGDETGYGIESQAA